MADRPDRPQRLLDVVQSAMGNTLRRGGDRARKVTFDPEPEPRARTYTIVSVDDHIVEPPDMFAGRLPARFAADAPHVVEAPMAPSRGTSPGSPTRR